MASHPLFRAFKANKASFGAWLTLPGTFPARTLAQASPHLDWVVVDCEHGLIPLVPGVAESVSAIQGARPGGGPSAIVRIPATGVTASSSWQIKHALDAGARGVLVPMVSTAEKASEVVADSLFPPGGRRGFGSPFTHGIWGVTVPEYLEAANKHILIMVQIETKEAVENVRAIAAVEGIDAVFIGPYDLSISLGYPPPSPDPHPEVEKVIQKIREEAHAVGTKCAIFCTSGAQGAIRAKQGFDMINVTSDTGSMTEGIAKHLADASGQ
ncbi:Pyruvate/Phosphoenolpyruvate kinase-like domain-containing protein [Gymnopilus junonius]|uniref:Pyruvate/Phosphoenolpyruvate kinase-like domain-containing protein n=1 Tax=Gymnopilus junonius TaxID=109634 RepID=A0A9P5NIZ8_GYMJU|nr:Pyruvate/Phosphoenolpyruvate kinase-like domain-containing protein [Gymnopilus junonius]